MQQIEEKNQAKSQPGFEPAPTNTTSLWLTTSTARLSHPDGPSGRANITNERPDNPTGIFRNPVDFVRMASGRGLKISPKSSGWASGFPTYYPTATRKTTWCRRLSQKTQKQAHYYYYTGKCYF